MADENTELGAMAEATATGLIMMADLATLSEDSPVEFTVEDRQDFEMVVDSLVEVAAMAAEGAEDMGPAGDVVVDFLNENPELANTAAEVGAAVLAEGGGGESEGGEGGPPPGEGGGEGGPPPESPPKDDSEE